MRVIASLAALSTAMLAAGVVGCATYQDDLARGQKAFEAAQYERSLAILRSLEPDVASRLTADEQARYAYLRGMTDLRIGYRLEARHWLSVARASEARTPNSLPPEWNAQLNEKLRILNEEVYANGATALNNHAAENTAGADQPASDEAAPAKKTKADDDAPAGDAGSASKTTK